MWDEWDHKYCMHSLTHSLSHSLSHSLTHSFTYSLTHLHTLSLTHMHTVSECVLSEHVLVLIHTHKLFSKCIKRADTLSRTHTLTHSLVNLILTKPSCTDTQFHTRTYIVLTSAITWWDSISFEKKPGL